MNSLEKGDSSMQKTTVHRLHRRSFLGTAAGAASLAALSGCGADVSSNPIPQNLVHAVPPGEAPETPKVNFGIIALTDCSPIVIAHEKGFFAKYGIESSISKPANWAAIRDALIKGDTQATHMLIGMPIASTMGLGGQEKTPIVIPWLLNRNGQAITLKNEWKGTVRNDPKALLPLANAAKAAGKKLAFAMTFPPGTHAMWIRYYLAAGGVDPDRDVELLTIPPPQMVANMKNGKMDGFCVGEPWNARAILDDCGYTSLATQEIWPDHPEKVCAFLGEFAEKNPKTVKAVLKGLHAASVWLDDLGNRAEQAEIVGRERYINCQPQLILDRLVGKYDFGDDRRLDDPHYMIFSSRNCNYPQPAYVKWWLTQFRRWGMVESAPDYAAISRQALRADLYEEAMKEINYQHGGQNEQPWTMFDGVTFDPQGDLEAYAKGFDIHNVKT